MKRESNSFREKFFPKSFRVPTEYQILNWEYEGGCLNGVCATNISIINGVLCETWWDKVKATSLPFLKSFRTFFGIKNKFQSS